jgi:hypothetical protein
MNKNILFVLALSWILVGCASKAPQFEGSLVGKLEISVPGCTTYALDDCTGDEDDPDNPKVTLNLDTWTLSPECVTARKGKIISIDLKSASKIEKGSVRLFPKKLENSFWAARTNSPNKNKIKIKVPIKKKSGANFPEGIYNYGISTDTKCIDPRINVIN